MKFIPSSLLIGASLVLVSMSLFGCSKGDDGGDGEEPEKPKIALEGEAKPEFLGRWEATNGRSNYTMSADGTYKFDGKAQTPGGAVENKFEGKWRVNGQDLLISDRDGNVMPYKFDLKGDTLVLTSKGSMAIRTELKKAKK